MQGPARRNPRHSLPPPAIEVTGGGGGPTPFSSNLKGILDFRALPNKSFDDLWNSIFLPLGHKDRLLAQAVLNFTARSKLQAVSLPLHGVILLVGPPGTGKTSLARGLASRTAAAVHGTFNYLEVEPHALASAALGKSQQAVSHLLGTVIAEQAASGPCIVVLDEVETLAANRSRMSMEANPIDVHRATDAVLAQLDHLATHTPHLLFIATSNFVGAIDEAFASRADMIMTIGLPSAEMCEAILLDTLDRLAQVYPKLKRLRDNPRVREAAKHSLGLDGRRIRKAVLSALALSKETAMDPSSLSPEAVYDSIELAQSERTRMEITK